MGKPESRSLSSRHARFPAPSTYSLTNATPYVVALADRAGRKATATVPGLTERLSAHDGKFLAT
ncbi:hypothetical protein [Rhodococcus opacus]|uniref:hypothetical protein n=1 Tax=Rhodococcus opacus TaxID=37919 RepID=UPI001057541C|nr:hypothetical protein [Rhodococcus opacus]